MRIKVSRSKNSESYFVIKDIYRNNKRTTKVVEALGNRQEILERHPGFDPLEWAKNYAKQLKEEEKKRTQKLSQSMILIKLSPRENNDRLILDIYFYNPFIMN